MRFSPVISSFLLVALVNLFIVFHVSAYTFFSNLKFGDRGLDVRELQIALNANQGTKIAEFGHGSPGNETDYFGSLTRNAVLRFQEAYRAEILVPAGVSSPTGFVGVLTRLKLNSLSPSSKSSQVSLPANVKVPTLPEEKPTTQDLIKFGSSLSQVKPQILGLSQYETGRGDSVTIYGQGFSATENKIHFGNSGVHATAISTNSTDLMFAVPENISFGQYYLWAENKNGTSYIENGKPFFTVNQNPHSAPSISSVLPARVSVASASAEQITVSGANFSASGNAIYSSIGIIKSLDSSDGRTLQFKLSSFERIGDIVEMKKYISKGSIPIPIIVKNDYGFSSEHTYLVIEF